MRVNSEIDIDVLAKRVLRFPRDPLRYLDDAGSVFIDGRAYLLKVDGYALSRSLYPWCTARDWGYRAVVTAVSDVITKGALPIAYAISIGLPPRWGKYELEEVVEGIFEAVRELGGYVVNIDTNYGNDGWIDIFVLAEYLTSPLPRCSREGDILVIPRKVGFGGASYLSYVTNASIPKYIALWGCRPRVNPRIVEFIRNARWGLRGSIDISDTLYEALDNLLKLDGLGPYIEAEPSSILIREYVELCKSLGLELEECALATCEEYVPVFSVDPSYLAEVLEKLRCIGESPYVLGCSVRRDLASWRGKPLKRIVWNHARGTTLISANYIKSNY